MGDYRIVVYRKESEGVWKQEFRIHGEAENAVDALTRAASAKRAHPSGRRNLSDAAAKRRGATSPVDRPVNGVKYPDLTVKLVGGSSNGMEIVGKVRQAMRRARISAEIISEFTTEATSGDFDKLLQTCMAWVNVE